MNKNELARIIAEEIDITLTSARNCIETVFDSLSKALEKGERIMFPGFGSFSISKRKARKGRNPKTGEEIQIPACKAVTFRAGKELKGLVNNNKKKK